MNPLIEFIEVKYKVSDTEKYIKNEKIPFEGCKYLTLEGVYMEYPLILRIGWKSELNMPVEQFVLNLKEGPKGTVAFFTTRERLNRFANCELGTPGKTTTDGVEPEE